uniref:Uncharacterized protein n=1 Tax=Ignisphaera aggregans TaxID=334771 RepID=A0A7J3MWK2_9CREN
MKIDDFLAILNKFTRSVIIKKNDARVIIGERGGRIIWISIGEDSNLLWTHPRIEKVFEANEWNQGGLRTWISPERNFFYRDPENFRGWFCPHTIDPASYRIVKSGNSRVVLEGEISAQDKLHNVDLRGYIRKEIELLEVYRGIVRLRVREGLLVDYPLRVNLWILAQVPITEAGVGTVLIPVKPMAQPIHYFVEIPPNRLTVKTDHVAFKIDGCFTSKIGVKPEDLRELGRAEISYVAKFNSGDWYMLMLSTKDAPIGQEDCLDVPKLNPEGLRGAVQSYNSGPEAFSDIRFGEIELHFSPAINIAGKNLSTIEYELIGFVGRREQVISKIRRMMKIKTPKIYIKP